jgi:LCP family protein required for cell wall assembly
MNARIRKDYHTYEPSEEKRPTNTKRTVFFVIGAIVALFIIGKSVSALVGGPHSNNPGDYDPVTLEPKDQGSILKRLGNFVFKNDVVLAGERDDRINILLMGMGGAGHDGPYLTDTMIIASVKPSTGEVAMVSIPRDLGVRIPGRGWYKINHASSFGEIERTNWGGAFATEVVEDTFDIDIHYYIRLDFVAFEEVIDEMNGVTVQVDTSFTDTEFPAANYQYQVVSFQQGERTMDGETALQFARSRHGNNGEGSDFARAKRQQKVILAMKEKALSFETLANPVRINNIINTLDSHITTNMEFSDIIAMLRIAREVNTDNITLLVLDNAVDGFLTAGTSPEGAFILSPKSGNFDDINETIANIFTYEAGKQQNTTPEQVVAPTLSTASIEIQNGTWIAGLAARTEARLEEINVSVETLSNTEVRPQPTSAIIKLTSEPLTDIMIGLQSELDIPVKQTLPTGMSYEPNTDILVILGEDFQE